MNRTLRIALAQMNATVGDLDGNTARIIENIGRARNEGAELVAFPELAITGYPPEDLLLRPSFIEGNLRCLDRIVAASKGITAVVGFVDRQDDIFNAAAIIHDGKIVGRYHKTFLPNYGVFDENRYFQTGTSAPVFVINGITIGVNICEDIWHPGGPIRVQSLVGGAEVIVNINASPYHAGKATFRERMLATRAADETVIVTYTNMVGGQDELVFDGASTIFNQSGNLVARARSFQEDLLIADLDVGGVFRTRLHDPRRRKEKVHFRPETLHKITVSEQYTPSGNKPQAARVTPRPESSEEVYSALVLGTADYVRKNGFKKVIIGLSGGIDSALTAAVAVDALGAENVVGISIPSPYTSRESRVDARKLAQNLGMEFKEIPLTRVFNAYLATLEKEFDGIPRDATEENLQARVRGNFIMALSNKYGWLVLTTGNKSEMSCGYCTLYGDMAGGFAVIKDVPKMLVYELSRYRNRLGKVIPERTIEREPTAELRPDQKDSDSLPPYPVLDPILQLYIEEDRSPDEIVGRGFEQETVMKVLKLVDTNEYKRRQAPPGVKITPRAFGRDRRLPITNRYRNI
ncbi:MAG: NAD+ synthase [Nitrospirota bacterium]|nr:NAD+ synthase [Nitrospirota bacterium]